MLKDVPLLHLDVDGYIALSLTYAGDINTIDIITDNTKLHAIC